MVFYIVFQDKVTSQLLPSRGKSAVTALWNPNTKHADSSPSWLSPRNSAPTFLVLFMSAVTVSNWISCAVFAPGVVARVIWAVSHRHRDHVVNTSHRVQLGNLDVGCVPHGHWWACSSQLSPRPSPNHWSFYKRFLVSCRPPPQLRHCHVFFPVATSRCMGGLVRGVEPSPIPHSSQAAFHSSPAQKTRLLSHSSLPKTRRETEQNRKILLLFFVWIWGSVREGGDPASGPPVLPLCLPTRHWFSIDNFHHLITFITW